jgi:hypothetical protein
MHVGLVQRGLQCTSLSHWKITCSRHDIAELALNNNHSLTNSVLSFQDERETVGDVSELSLEELMKQNQGLWCTADWYVIYVNFVNFACEEEMLDVSKAIICFQFLVILIEDLLHVYIIGWNKEMFKTLIYVL